MSDENGMFLSPTEAFARFELQLERQPLPIPAEELAALAQRVQAIEAHGFTSTIGNIFSLRVWAGTLEETFKWHWRWMFGDELPIEFPTHSQAMRLIRMVADRLRLGERPSIVPVAVDFTVGSDKSLTAAQNSRSASVETMAACMLHPALEPGLVWTRHPGPWLGGIELLDESTDQWRNALRMILNQGGPLLVVMRESAGLTSVTPSVREL